MVRLKIDGREMSVPAGTTIMEAARSGGIDIPSLCYHKRLLPIGSCSMCIVEIEGRLDPVTSCSTVVEEGIEVTTESEALRGAQGCQSEKDSAASCPRLPHLRRGGGMRSPKYRLPARPYRSPV